MFFSAHGRIGELSVQLWAAVEQRDTSHFCFVAGHIVLFTGGLVALHISAHRITKMVSIFIFLLGTILADRACHVAASFDAQSRLARSRNYGGGRGRVTSMTGSRVRLMCSKIKINQSLLTQYISTIFVLYSTVRAGIFTTKKHGYDKR